MVACGLFWVLRRLASKPLEPPGTEPAPPAGAGRWFMLHALPLVFVLAGLALYTMLGGADFGAGFWQLFAGRGERGRARFASTPTTR